jgi:hypothetical protein
MGIKRFYMRKLLFFTLFLLVCIFPVKAQDEFKPGGKGTGTLFFNYHHDFTKETEQKNAFEIERAYLGYSYEFSKSISSRIVLDVGHDGEAYTAFVKNAVLDWQLFPKLKFTAGIFTLKQFDTQERFWDYRYIMKSFDDQYGLGSSADLGVNLEFPINEMITINTFILNGEGYQSLQDINGTLRVGGNIIVKPVKGLTAKFYYDQMAGKDIVIPVDTTTISNISIFIGYEIKDKFRLGIEYNNLVDGKDYKTFAHGYKLGGTSIYGTYIISSKLELLARYDILKSNKIENTNEVWNLSGDGSMILGGIQYKPVKGVNLALNYRAWLYDKPDTPTDSEVYINIGINF